MFDFEASNDLLLYPFFGDEESVAEALFPDEGLGWGARAQSLSEALLPLVESPPSTPPPQSPWMCYARYKTELCSRYTELGSCKYAERCQFAHGLRDLRVPSRHPKYKTEPCRAFHGGGFCAYGARCLFVHSPKEQRPVKPPRSRNVPCRTFRSFGVCPFGARCHFLHVEGDGVTAEDKAPRPPAQDQRPRGSLCRTFSAFGFCLYGTRCRYQHCLPSGNSQSPGAGAASAVPCGPQLLGSRRASSPASDMTSSSSTSSPPSSLPSPVYLEEHPLLTPPVFSSEPLEQEAFSFSGQHLNNLLLPLAWRLQQLESALTRPTASSGVEGEAVAGAHHKSQLGLCS